MKNPKTEGAVQLCVLLAMLTDGASPDLLSESLQSGTDEDLCEGINASAETIAARFREDLGEVRTLGARFADSLNSTGGPEDSFLYAASKAMAHYRLNGCIEAEWAFEAAERVAFAGGSRDVEVKKNQLGELARERNVNVSERLR